MTDTFLFLSDFLNFFKVFWIPLIPSWSVHLLFILLLGPGPTIGNNSTQSPQKRVGPTACNSVQTCDGNRRKSQLEVLQVNM